MTDTRLKHTVINGIVVIIYNRVTINKIDIKALALIEIETHKCK